MKMHWQPGRLASVRYSYRYVSPAEVSNPCLRLSVCPRCAQLHRLDYKYNYCMAFRLDIRT